MTRYRSPVSDLLTKDHESKRYEIIARTLHDTQLRQGVFPEQTARLPRVEVPVDLWEEHESALNHETAGWVSAWRTLLPSDAVPRSYLGLTSSNLTDTARAIEALDVLVCLEDQVSRISQSLDTIIERLGGTKREGRTHGQVAVPVEMKSVYQRIRWELNKRIEECAHNTPLAALGGPVGAGHPVVLTPAIVTQTAEALEVKLDEHPTQLASRLQLLAWCQSVYNLIAVCEQLALHHRLESVSGIDRFREGFNKGVQKGSSSMPHKQNPIKSERVCGLSRVARGYLGALTEATSTLWWERDLSNSSTERVAYYGLIETASFVLAETNTILETSQINLPTAPLDPRSFSAEQLVEQQLMGVNPDQAYYLIQQRNIND